MSRAGSAARAEALGVEIYPGFAATEVLFGDNGEVVGVATGDMGIARDGHRKPSFTRGMELRGKYTLFAEGARGSLSQAADRQIRPRRAARSAKIRHRPQGIVAGRSGPGAARASCSTTFGWPLDQFTGGGSFLYHMEDGLVVGRLRRASQLPQSDAVAVRRIPALQDASADRRDARRRQAARLWRARDHRRRLAIGAEARLSGRRADRLRRGLPQCAAHQGIA